jgi:hypothetical protein
MSITNLIAQINAEIERLQKARSLLSAMETTKAKTKTKTKDKAKAKTANPKKSPAKKKRHISKEGRARIAAAQRKRWAKLAPAPF